VSRLPHVAVVGGRGWVGRAVLRAAAYHGVPVTVVSRGTGPGVVTVDPEVPATLARALDGVDAVINAAGYRGPDAECARAANFAMPDRLGRLSLEQGWRLVHLGSASEYGLVEGTEPLREDQFCAPPTLYGLTKLAGTRAVQHWREAGAPATVARVFNIAAADLPADNPIRDIATQVRAAAGSGAALGEVAIGDPTMVRDISRRSWVAAAILALAVGPSGADHPVVNVCSGEEVRFGDLARAMARHLAVRITVRDLGWPRGGHIVGDPTLLRSLVDLPVHEPDSGSHMQSLVRSILGPSSPLVALPGEHPCHL
jgi:NDP-hexose 4-ketoreductase